MSGQVRNTRNRAGWARVRIARVQNRENRTIHRLKHNSRQRV